MRNFDINRAVTKGPNVKCFNVKLSFMTREEVFNAALDLLKKKVSNVESQLTDLQHSLMSETKSTAGDKHETGRAITHLEQEKLSGQMKLLREHLALTESLKNINVTEVVRNGSLVITDKGNFALAAPLGKVEASSGIFIFLSVASPLGKELLNQKAGERIRFNSVEYLIEAIK